jgi:hypothetical protein
MQFCVAASEYEKFVNKCSLVRDGMEPAPRPLFMWVPSCQEKRSVVESPDLRSLESPLPTFEKGEIVDFQGKERRDRECVARSSEGD